MIKVFHILPEDMARGAQSYARAIADRLDDESASHEVVTLFRSPPTAAMPDIELGVPLGRLRSAGLHPLVVWRLRRLLSAMRPDVLVAHGGEAAKYAAVAKPKGLPMIYLMIGAAHPKLRRTLSRLLYAMVLRKSWRVVTVSRALAEEAHTLHGVPVDRIVMIPNGRDPETFRPAHDGPRSRVRLGWVGRVDDAKRPGWFIDVVSGLVRRGAPVEGWMAGSGPLLDDVKELGRERGVEVLGDRDDVADLLRASDMLVFTGRPPEGMPGVLIEAALCGLPVVTTDVPGAVEVVANGETGLIVAVDDFEGLSEAVWSLLSDADRRLRMGRRARERAVDLFSLEKSVDDWRSLIAAATA